MEEVESRRAGYLPLLAIGLMLVWCLLINLVGLHTWGYGPLSFCLLLGMAGLVGLAKVLGVKLRSGRNPRGWGIIAASAVIFLLCGWFLTSQWMVYRQLQDQNLQSDISTNTYSAGLYAFGLHTNPYTSPNQTGHRVEGAPNVSIVGNQLTMFGVPYYYGYPYFPGMFLSYEPFRRLDGTPQSIRAGNGVFYILLLAAMAWLAAILAPRGLRILAALLGVMGFACTVVLGGQLFLFCVTDIIIAFFTIAGFIAAHYGRHSLAGVLFGWAFACKLIPGGLFILVVGLWYWRSPVRWKFFLPMLATIAVVIFPYLLSDPSAFVSATILYYLTEHVRGDSTAAWYFLPAGLQPIFQVVGYGGVLAIIFWASRRKSFGLLGALAICFIASAVFVAFNRMAHLNYIWAIAPLGSVALAAAALGALGRTLPAGPSPANNPDISVA
jgi:hypothetical protein